MTYDETVAKMEAIDHVHKLLTEKHDALMAEYDTLRFVRWGIERLSPRAHEIVGASKVMRVFGRTLLAEHSKLYEEIMSNSVRP